MSNLKNFFIFLNQLEKTYTTQLKDIDNKIDKLKSDIVNFENNLSNPSKFIRNMRALIYDYDIKNFDQDYIEHEIKNTVGFNYETRAFKPLNMELSLVLKDFKRQRKSIKGSLADISKLKVCFNENAFLVSQLDSNCFKIVQEVLGLMNIKDVAKTLQYLTIYNTRLMQKSLEDVIEEQKTSSLQKVVGADKTVEEKVIIPKIGKKVIDVSGNKTITEAQNIISANQEFVMVINEEEKDCYELIVEEEEYIFNLAVNNISNLKVSIMVLTNLVNKAISIGLTNELENLIADVIDSYKSLKEVVKKEEEESLKQKALEDKFKQEKKKLEDLESDKIEKILIEEQDFLESLNDYEKSYNENIANFSSNDWNYIESLDALNAAYHITTESNSVVYGQCLQLIKISDNLTEDNYLKYYSLKQILDLKSSLDEIEDSHNLTIVISDLKQVVRNYEENLRVEVPKIEEQKDSHNLVVYLQDNNQTLIEDFIFNDKITSKNINLSHINGISYLIKILKDSGIDAIQKNSTKAKGDNLTDGELRIIHSGSVYLAFKYFSKIYNGDVVPIITIISAGIKLGDDKRFFDYINESTTLTTLDNFESTVLPTIFDGRRLEDIKREFLSLEQQMLSNLTSYVNNGHRKNGNLNIG
ncbi:MAG: hypothetical protein IJA94_06220 [Bacilli bacterium]|nr:hypothetical protein [Bacilli bacterium]